MDINLAGGFNPSEKYEVSWDDDIPNIWKNHPNVPNHQSVIIHRDSIREFSKSHWDVYGPRKLIMANSPCFQYLRQSMFEAKSYSYPMVYNQQVVK